MFSSLKGKLIVPIVAVLVAMIVFIVVYVTVATADIASGLAQERIDNASRAASSHLSMRQQEALTVALASSNRSTILENLHNWNAHVDRARGRLRLIQYLTETAETLGVDSFVMRDAQGQVIIRLHDLDHFGDIDGSVAGNRALVGGG